VEVSKQRLIIVSNRAPISVTEKDGRLQSKRALGGLATALAKVWERPGCMWVGWSGLARSFSQAEYESLELGDKLALINLESELYRRYYGSFANGSLWPVFHGLTPPTLYQPEDLEATREVTERFAKCLEHVAGPDDLIWVHDYPLVLLPDVLRRRGMRNKVGMFMHIPFPDLADFRQLPDHREIALSLAQVNVLGFQTNGDVRRFLAYAEAEGIDVRGVQVQAFPIGIDFEQFAKALELPEAQEFAADIASRYDGKRVVFSVSRQDYTKGIPEQLQAVDRMLQLTKRRDVIYKLVVAPSREDLKAYQQLRERTERLVRQINQRHGVDDWQPVDYEYRGYGVAELAAWYQRADVMLVTPLADGMNLIAKEFAAANKGLGVLVLGERAGAADQMTEALQVNPRDTGAMAAAIREGLDMPEPERRRRMLALRRGVQREDVTGWSRHFLSALEGQDAPTSPEVGASQPS
jgi:trehalose 6-phosphate synthase/phosphatase